jgi:hypothetical protein
MGLTREARPLRKRNKILVYAAYLLVVGVIFVAGAEFLLRQNGILPYEPTDVTPVVLPGGKLYQSHATLGYSYIPGEFTVILETGYIFNVTHLPNTLRVTRRIDGSPLRAEKGELWIFGCSLVHGWSIEDEETFPWLLQERFPDYEVTNFGVGGYGTIHSLLQFREALKSKTPKVVVLAYAGFHDERNTFSRFRRKSVASANKLGPLIQPYARLNDDEQLQYFFADVEYPEFPLMRYSALAHFIELEYNFYEAVSHKSHFVSRRLVKQMARIARQHGVTFILANIYEGRAMQEYAQENGIPNVDIAVNLYLPANSNLPHDSHPSAIANRQYADKLEIFLRRFLAE